MKHFFTLIAAIAFTGVASAQLALDNPPVTVYGGYNDAGIDAHFDIQNMGNTDVDVIVAREEVTMVGNAASSFCWGTACYPPTVSISPDPATIAANSSESSFRGYYHPAGNSGVGTVKWYFYVDGDSANTVMPITIDYDASFAESVNDITLTNTLGQAYPNPADKTTAINYSHNGNKADIVVYDMLGAEVHRYALDARQGVSILNTSGLRNGVYFYAIVVDNEVKATNKLVVAHK